MAQRSKHTTIIILVGLLLVALLAGGVFAWNHYRTSTPKPTTDNTVTSKPIDYKEATADQQAAGAAIKQQQADSSSPATTSGTTNVTLTSTSVNDGTLYVRALIDGVVSSGTCRLTLKNGSQTITRTADVQAMASSSTCKGFNVPVSDLSPGTWDITVTYTGGTSTGTAKGEVTI